MKKNVMSISLVLLFAFYSAASGLMAPVYSGAAEAPHEVSENLKEYMKIFYSADPIDKVKKFYSVKAGKMEELKSKNGFKKIIQKKDRGIYDTHEPSELGVIINTGIKKTGKDKSSLYNHDYFSYLKTLSAQLDEKSREDYEEICEKYEELIYSYYMPSDKKDRRGRALNKAQSMIAEFKEKNPGISEESDSAEQSSKKMQELMQQGRMAEAIEMSKSMGKKMKKALKPAPEKWDEYIKLLEDISKNHAYRTKIIIHTGK